LGGRGIYSPSFACPERSRRIRRGKGRNQPALPHPHSLFGNAPPYPSTPLRAGKGEGKNPVAPARAYHSVNELVNTYRDDREKNPGACGRGCAPVPKTLLRGEDCLSVLRLRSATPVLSVVEGSVVEGLIRPTIPFRLTHGKNVEYGLPNLGCLGKSGETRVS